MRDHEGALVKALIAWLKGDGDCRRCWAIR